MKKRPIEFPINNAERRRNRLGKHSVPCLASERWIEFPKRSAGSLEAGELIKLSIMTGSGNQQEEKRKICDLVVTREALLKAIDTVKNPDEE